MFLHPIFLFGRYLSTFTFSGNSIAKSLIIVFLTFLLKKMLHPGIALVVHFGHFLLFFLDVNFGLKNDVIECEFN